MASDEKIDQDHDQLLFPMEEDCSYAMQIASSSIFPMVMKAAIELGLLDIIFKAGVNACLSAEEIAFQLNTTNPHAPEMVDRILRLLASYSLVSCTLRAKHNGSSCSGNHQRVYGLKPAAKFFLHDREELTLSHSMLMFLDKVFMDSWYVLKDVVMEGGIPFNKVHGMGVYEYLSIDLRFNQVFNKAMISHTTIVMNSILEKYQGFKGIKVLVDVGGGIGLTLKMIISQYPSINGINFDLPHVIQDAPSSSGIVHVPGDMFAGVPKGESILLKCILHNWNDDDCVKILKNCYEALPEEGNLIVIETVIAEVPETSTASRCTFQIDLQMMAQHIGGKERTKEEYESLALNAGFKSVRFDCLACNNCVMEFCK